MTAIEWTDETWNPTVGCSRVSPGCDHCYAETFASRGLHPAHAAATAGGKWTGDVVLVPERLDVPNVADGKRVFVGSMSDIFHETVPDQYLADIFDVMACHGKASRLTFQVLTKRTQRMARLLNRWADEGYRGAPNVWLGTSVENQRYADVRIPHLLETPAAVRFLSVEPLLGPVDLDLYLWGDWRRVNYPDGAYTGRKEQPRREPRIDWVIVGGESGPGARPMHPEWVRSIRDQCVAAAVPFFFKQWGEWAPAQFTEAFDHAERHQWMTMTSSGLFATPEATVARVGKKAAGRELDGYTWDEMPA